MIEIRFITNTQLDGVLYKLDDVIQIDDARANRCIDECWAVDNVTGRAGTAKEGAVKIEVHNVTMGMSCI